MKKFLLVTILLTSIIAFSQDQKFTQVDVDSLIAQKNNDMSHMVNLKKMLTSNDELIGWGTYYAHMSQVHYNTSKILDSSIFYAEKAVNYITRISILTEKDKSDLMKANYYLGIVYEKKGQYLRSTDFLLKGLDLAKELPKNKAWLPFLNSRIASNHLKVGDIEKAQVIYKESIKDTLYMSSPKAAGSIYNRLGVTYGYLNKIDSAKSAYKKAIAIYESNDLLNKSIAPHQNMGDIYFKERDAKKATFHYNKAVTIGEENKNSNRFTNAYGAYLSIQKGEIQKGKQVLNTILDSLATLKRYDSNSRDLTTIGMDFLSLAYRKEGRLDMAYGVLEEKNLFLEKFHDQMMKEKLQELNTQYEVKQKDQSISKLTAVNEEQKTIIKQRDIITLILGGLLVAIIVIGTLIMRQRKLNAKFKTVSLEQRLLRSQLNPHFIYNALNTVSLLAQTKSEKTVPYILKFGSLMRRILENSREEFVVLTEELAAVNDYLELESDFSKKFKYDINIMDTIDMEGVFIPPMFIQPFVENAIAHGIAGINNGKINLDLQLDEKARLIKCVISDNGIGLKKSLKNKKNGHNSLSGKILKERLDLYSKSMKTRARYTIGSPIMGGTRVEVYLPYYYEE